MKKQLSILMLLAAFLLPWASRAQGSTISSFPFTCNFENAADNAYWSFQNASNAWRIGAAVANGGDSALYVSDNNGTANSYSGSACVSYAYLTFEITNPGQYALQFDWKCNGESTYDFLRVAVAPSTTPLTSTYTDWTATSVPSGFIAVDGGNKLNLQTTWQTKASAVSIPAAGTYRLLFVWRNDGSVYNAPPAAIDNIVITELSCPQPTNLAAIPAADQLSLSWTAGGSESQWKVVINNSFEDYTYTNSYVATGLTGNTPYNVKVYAICGAGDTSMATSADFRTTCVAISQMPYFNDFEDEPAYSSSTTPYADAFPSCWTRINDASGTYNYYPYITTTASYVHSGSKGMYWYHTTTTTYADNEYAVLPPVDLDVYDMSDLTLSFFAKTTSTSYHPQPIVGVMTNPTDASTFTPVYTFTATEITTDWQIFVVSLASYTGTGNYIAIKWPRPSSTSYMAIDDIFLTDEWCDMPSDVSASATLDEITVSWGSNSGSSFSVYVGQDTITNVTDTFYTFLNLSSSTEYNYGVATECSDGISMFATGSIRTLCSYIDSLPYTYGFEDMATGSSSVRPVIPCWHHLNNGSQYFGYPYVSSTTPHSGSRNLYWYGTTTTGTYGDYQIVVLPGVDTSLYPINTLQLTFWARPSSTSYSPVFQVGVMSDPNDASTFQQLGEVQVESNTTWQEFTVMLGGFSGTGNFVAVRALRPTSSWYAYTDDFTLELMPPCPPVGNMRADSMSVDWAAISWTEMGSASSWVLEYDTVDFVPGSGAASISMIVSDTSYLMSGLDTGYTYYVYVRADCGSDTSEFEGFTVTTLAGLPATVPYYCDFESGISNGWDFVQNGQTNYWIVGTDTHNGGSRSMYITNNGTSNSYTNTTTCYSFATRVFNLTEAGEYAYSYDWKAYGESSYDFIRAALVPVGTVITAGAYSGFDNASAMPVGGIALDGGYRLNLQSSWQTQSGTFTITTPGTYVWVIMWRNDASGGTTPPAAIDNVNLVRNTCPAPVNLVTSDITENSITLSWQPVGDESSWEVSNGVDVVVVSDTSYIFNSLNASTTYTFTVRAVCGSDDSSMTISTIANTSCAYAVLPIIEDFDGITGSTATSGMANILPPCWEYYNDGTRTNYQGCPYIYSSSTYAHSGSNSIRFYSYNSSGDSNQYLILPPVDPDEYMISDLQLSFWLRGNSTSASYFANVVVGVMTNPSVESSFIPYDTINYASTTYAYQEVNFNHYTGPHGRVTLLFPKPLSSAQYEYGYVDDLMLGPIPTCLSVENLTSTYASMDTVILAWQPGGDETQWEVSYDSVSFIVYDTTCVVDNLSANTEYTFSVRAICSAGDTSYPVSYAARTDCGAITVLPYFESFEGLPAGTSSSLDCGVPCWGRLDNASTYHFGYIGSPSSWPSGGHTGSGFLYYYMPTTTGTYADWIITVLPPIDVTTYPINSLQVSFWVKMNSTSTQGDIQVGVISNTNEDSTFVPLDTVHVAGNVYDLKTAYLSGYTGMGSHIALKFLRDPGTTTYYFVDDVTVEPMPDCPPVSNIVLAGLDSNYITVTWTENGDAASWNVEYGVSGFTPGTGTTATVTTNSITITGLTSNTEYDVYVTPECSGGVAATRMQTFRTANTYIQLPLSCNFENASQNAIWTLENGTNTNKWYIGNATNNGGSNALYISDNNGVSNNYTISSATVDFAYTDVMISAPGDYGFSFDWKCYGESSLDYIRAALVPATETLTAGTTLPTGLSATSMPSGWISLDGNSKLNLQTNWQTRSDVISIASAGVYHLVFVFRCDGSVGTQPPAAIDNVELAQMTCPRPLNVTLSNLTQTSVDVTWSAGSATMWQYQLDNNTPVVVTDTTCSLTGLTSNTEYTFRVRAICSSTDTSFWMVYSFRTPCGYLTLPYTQDFEAETTGSSSTGSAFANCWTRLNNGTSYGGYPYVSSSSTYNHTTGGTKGLYWYNSTTTGTYGDYQCVVLPPVDPAVSIDSLQLSFWAKASSTSYTPMFQIGVMTDPNNIATFVGVDTITISGTTWTEIEIPLTTYTGTGKYVAVKSDRATSSWYAYVDDFLLDYVPTCLVPHDITSTTASTTSITVDWTDLSTAASWEIRYGQVGSSTTTTVVTNSHPYTVSGLSSLTSYSFEVRAICTAYDTSRWSTPVTLATEMCDNAVIAFTGAATGTNNQGPVNNFYRHTLTETIIDSAELAGIGVISHVGYSYNYSSPSTVKTDVNIWLQPTTKNEFTSNTDAVAVNPATAVKVYHGPLNCSQGWNYFAFDTNYVWDGHSNILVIVQDNSGDYDGSSYVFDITSHTDYKYLVYYRDGTAGVDTISAYNPSTFTATTAYRYQRRPTMKLMSCNAAPCVTPDFDSVMPAETALSFTVANDGNSVTIEAVATTEPWTDSLAATLTPVTGSSTDVITINGLAENTPYTLAIRSVCGSGRYSDWTTLAVSTLRHPCAVPTGITVTDNTYDGATVSWTAGENETEWEVMVFCASPVFEHVYNVSENPTYTVTGLDDSVTYSVAVRAVCDPTWKSVWSDTVALATANCPQVTGVSASGITSSAATINWTSNEAVRYEIEYGDMGFPEGTGTVVTSQTNSVNLSNLESESTYDVYVRGFCTETVSSNWSARYRFTTATQGIDDVEGSNVTLFPNPASTMVTIRGIEGESTVTVVDLNGREVFKTNADNTLTIDLTGYAKGAYFVRITGERTTAIRKLVVK